MDIQELEQEISNFFATATKEDIEESFVGIDAQNLIERTCRHPEHNGPNILNMVIPSEGITFYCPSCHKKNKFVKYF